MTGKGKRSGLTRVEVLLVTAILFLGAFMVWPVLASSSAAGRRGTCASHLRRIGRAYGMYLADYGRYPNPASLVHGAYLKDTGRLFCPDDRSSGLGRTASSYHFRERMPPDFTPVSQVTHLDPSVALVACDRHLGRRAGAKGSSSGGSPAAGYPYHLVLRAGGSVDRVHVSRIRTFYLPGDRLTFMYAYPGDPGYEHAEK